MEHSLNAGTILKDKLLKRTQIVNWSNVPLEQTKLDSESLKDLHLTSFNDPYDTLIYSDLILAALNMSPAVKEVVDLGAGSSIPSLLAVKKTNRTDLIIKAYDIDPEAQHIGRENAESLGLADQLEVWFASTTQALHGQDFNHCPTLVVSNPPYIATPETKNEEPKFSPINGGPDGQKYLKEILSFDYPADTTLALLWGSLTRPHEILDLIHAHYEVLHVEAYRVHFGQYTKDPELKNYLYQLRDNGDVYFENDPEVGEVQMVFGTILRKLYNK